MMKECASKSKTPPQATTRTMDQKAGKEPSPNNELLSLFVFVDHFAVYVPRTSWLLGPSSLILRLDRQHHRWMALVVREASHVLPFTPSGQALSDLVVMQGKADVGRMMVGMCGWLALV